MQARHCAEIILGLYEELTDGYELITRRSKSRFERREWHAFQADAVERLDLYRTVVDAGVAGLKRQLGPAAEDHDMFPRVKTAFAALVRERNDCELAETFFNSLTRRLFSGVGVDPAVQFVDSDVGEPPADAPSDTYFTYSGKDDLASIVRQILDHLRFEAPFEDLERDVAAVAGRISERVGTATLEEIDVLKTLFFRNKGCYVAGRMRIDGALVPLVLPILHEEGGIFVDAVLMEEAEVSIVFSFTRSYFFCDTRCPADIIAFLRTIMPRKPLNELYNSLGHNKHGKTLLYRDLMRHLANSDGRFEEARGEKGMVMLVFTLPAFDVVFKLIRDTFAYPKTSTREQVKQQYRLVFTHDRAGRLVDAQEFQGLTFKKDRFTPELLTQLERDTSYSVKIDGDDVIINYMYTERRLVPLNIYLGEAPLEAAVDAVVDYGYAVKDLIHANIFPGDLLLKNFGVTRHGRVVFYDYDELCLITECNFRAIPPAPSIQDELWGEPWYSVAENDIFPEELRYFLGLFGELREAYEAHHADLFDPVYWQDIQRRIREGWIADIYPYKESRRLPRGERAALPA